MIVNDAPKMPSVQEAYALALEGLTPVIGRRRVRRGRIARGVLRWLGVRFS